jgi:hypothetical protein
MYLYKNTKSKRLTQNKKNTIRCHASYFIYVHITRKNTLISLDKIKIYKKIPRKCLYIERSKKSSYKNSRQDTKNYKIQKLHKLQKIFT